MEDLGAGNGAVERWGANRAWMVEKWVLTTSARAFFVRPVAQHHYCLDNSVWKLDRRESEDGPARVKQKRDASMPEPCGERKKGEENKKMTFSGLQVTLG